MNLIHGLTRRWVPALALCLLIALIPLPEAQAEEIYTRAARGVVDVAPDGTVAALQLEGDLGSARDGFEALMRSWQFNPITTTEGERVERSVRVNMVVDLYATRQEDNSFEISTGRPDFEPADDSGYVRGGSRVEHFPTPRYPEESAAGGHEGTVVLLVEVAADGSVTRVGTRTAALLNVQPRGAPLRAMRPFIREAHRAARGMRFAPSELELRQLMLPFQFTFHGRDQEAWSRIVFVPRAQEPWVAESLASNTRESREVEELDAGGRPVDKRVALATEIDDPWLQLPGPDPLP